MPAKLSAAVLLLFSLSLYAFPENLETRQDKELAGVYFNNALSALKAGNSTGSLELLNVSILFNKDSSDSRYLKALILSGMGKYQPSQKELKIAFLLGSWGHFSSFDGKKLFADNFMHQGDSESAFETLAPLSDTLSNDESAARVFTLSAAASGHQNQAVQTARLFPSKDFSQKILARYDTGWRNSAIGKIMQGDPALYYTKEAVQEIILLAPDAYLPKMLSYYQNRWGNDRFYQINSLITDDSNLEKRIELVFDKTESIGRGDMVRIKQILDKKNIEYDAEAFFKDKKIIINEDENKDGLIDGQTILDSGFITETVTDANHDTLDDYKITSPGGKIKKVMIRTKDKKIEAAYKPYPFLSEYTVTLEGRRRVYHILPYEAVYPVVVIPESIVDDTLRLNEYVEELSPLYLETVSTQIEETSLTGDEVLVAERKSLQDTKLKILHDNGLIFSEREYRGEKVAAEKKDIDGDGIPDLLYTYKDGSLQSASVDRNHNGYPEYMEEYIPVHITKWDFDDDGTFDYREYMEKGKLIREYSTNMDGFFDLRFEGRAGLENNGLVQ